MNGTELSHRFKLRKIQAGDGLFSDVASKLASVVTSDLGKKLITKTVNSVIDNGAKKAGEFIVEQLSKKPGEVIREHFANMKKPPLTDEEKHIQEVIDKILKI